MICICCLCRASFLNTFCIGSRHDAIAVRQAYTGAAFNDDDDDWPDEDDAVSSYLPGSLGSVGRSVDTGTVTGTNISSSYPTEQFSDRQSQYSRNYDEPPPPIYPPYGGGGGYQPPMQAGMPPMGSENYAMRVPPDRGANGMQNGYITGTSGTTGGYLPQNGGGGMTHYVRGHANQSPSSPLLQPPESEGSSDGYLDGAPPPIPDNVFQTKGRDGTVYQTKGRPPRQ